MVRSIGGAAACVLLCVAANAADAPYKPAAAPRVVMHTWAKVPTVDEISRLYPVRAIADELQAVITAQCTVQEDLALACKDLVSDPPEVKDFDDAALRVIALYRVAPVLRDGRPAVGWTFPLRVRFQLE